MPFGITTEIDSFSIIFLGNYEKKIIKKIGVSILLKQKYYGEQYFYAPLNGDRLPFYVVLSHFFFKTCQY